MLIKDKNDWHYSVLFRYEKLEDETVRTICSIKKLATDEYTFGFADCSKNDKFNKHTGRKLAFQRAIAKLTNDKEERRLFWQGFFINIRKDPSYKKFWKYMYESNLPSVQF
jgi:hypothetical protein